MGRFFTTEEFGTRIEATEMSALDSDVNKAIFSTRVTIPPGSKIIWGISTPNFGRPGGGIEIYSEDYKNFNYGNRIELK